MVNPKLHKVIQDAFYREFGTAPTPDGHLYPFALGLVTEAVKLAISEIRAAPTGQLYTAEHCEILEGLLAPERIQP